MRRGAMTCVKRAAARRLTPLNAEAAAAAYAAAGHTRGVFGGPSS
jgi:hypothetical protein